MGMWMVRLWNAAEAFGIFAHGRGDQEEICTRNILEAEVVLRRVAT